jgi:hypothetical protein
MRLRRVSIPCKPSSRPQGRLADPTGCRHPSRAYGGPRGSRTHNPRIKRPQLPAAYGSTGLQQPHECPHRAPDSPWVAASSRHETCHAAAETRRGEGESARSGPRRTPRIRSGLDQASCSSLSCGVSSAGGVRVVLVIRVVAQRRLGPTTSASTRYAVRFSPDCLSVHASMVTVSCTKTRSPFANDAARFSARACGSGHLGPLPAVQATG